MGEVTRLPCPTCSGPTRETVGMVCQTCGTDYSAQINIETADRNLLRRMAEAYLTANHDYFGQDLSPFEDSMRAILDVLIDSGAVQGGGVR